MRFPSHLLRPSTFRSEPLMAAMAAIAAGMFVGTWLIGPAITTRDSAEPPAQAWPARTSFEDMVARPDPMPYRAPTPSFDMSGRPNYAAAAKAKAKAGGQAVDEESAPVPLRTYRSSSRNSPSLDRHRVY